MCVTDIPVSLSPPVTILSKLFARAIFLDVYTLKFQKHSRNNLLFKKCLTVMIRFDTSGAYFILVARGRAHVDNV